MGRKKLFSLIEIAVAMAVASIGVAAIMALLPLAVKSSSDSIGDTLATDAANTVIARIDEMILENFDVARNLPSYPTSASSAASAVSAASAGNSLQGSHRHACDLR